MQQHSTQRTWRVNAISKEKSPTETHLYFRDTAGDTGDNPIELNKTISEVLQVHESDNNIYAASS